MGQRAASKGVPARVEVKESGTFRLSEACLKRSDSEIQFVLPTGDDGMSLGTIILIILVIALLGGFSGLGGGPFYGTGYYGGGGLGLVLVIVLILVLLGKL